MSKTNSQVIQAWVYGNSAKSGNGNLSTDGQDLFSYAMKIGRRSPVDGYIEVLDVRGKKHSYSVTTSHHVSMAIYGSKGRLVEPVHTSRGYGGWREWPDVVLAQENYKKLCALAQTAYDAAYARGHNIPRYTFEYDRKNWTAYAKCPTCGKGVHVELFPAPNGIDISGEAVALNCNPKPAKIEREIKSGEPGYGYPAPK